MQFIIDHLAATVIGVTVLLTLAVVMLTSQQTTIDITADYATRTQTLSFVDTMERDFRNLGNGVAPTDPMILEYVWDSASKHLVFLATVDTVMTAPVEKIRYSLVERDSITVVIDGEKRQVGVYAVEREMEVGGTFQPSGGSAPVLADFRIQLLDKTGAPVGADLDETRIVAIDMKMVSGLGGEGSVGQASWQTRFRPISLAMRG